MDLKIPLKVELREIDKLVVAQELKDRTDPGSEEYEINLEDIEYVVRQSAEQTLQRDRKVRAIVATYDTSEEKLLPEFFDLFRSELGMALSFGNESRKVILNNKKEGPQKSARDLAVEKVLKTIETVRADLKEKAETMESKRAAKTANYFFRQFDYMKSHPKYEEISALAGEVKSDSDLEKLISGSERLAEINLKKIAGQSLKRIKKIREGDIREIVDSGGRLAQSIAQNIHKYLLDTFNISFNNSSTANVYSLDNLEKYLNDNIFDKIRKSPKKGFQIGDLVKIKSNRHETSVISDIKKVGSETVYSVEGSFFLEDYLAIDLRLSEKGPFSKLIKEAKKKKKNLKNYITETLIKKTCQIEIDKAVADEVNTFIRKTGETLDHSGKEEQKFQADRYVRLLKQRAAEEYGRELRDVLWGNNSKIEYLASLGGTETDAKSSEIAAAVVKGAILRTAKSAVREEYMEAMIKFLKRKKIIKKSSEYSAEVYEIKIPAANKQIKATMESMNHKFLIELAKKGVKSDSWKSKGTYVYSGNKSAETKGRILDPFAIGQSFLEDLVLVAPHFVKNDRQKEALAIAKLMIAGTPVVQRDARAVLSKDNKIYFDAIVEAVGRHKIEQETHSRLKDFNLYDDIEQRKATVQSRKFEDKYIEGGNRAVQIALRDLVVSEVIAALQTGQDSRRIWKDFSTVWERYNPKGYDLPNLNLGTNRELPKEIIMATVRSAPVLFKSFQGTGSCISEYKHRAETYTKDLGTVNFSIFDQKTSVGYVRAYCMEDVKSGEPILAVDTIEIPRKQFESHKDYLLAAGLAAIQFGLDHNFHYILGGDARVAHGIRQAFGDQYLERKLRKMGIHTIDIEGFPTYSYSLNFMGFTGKTKSPVLMLNWKRSMKEVVST